MLWLLLDILRGYTACDHYGWTVSCRTADLGFFATTTVGIEPDHDIGGEG